MVEPGLLSSTLSLSLRRVAIFFALGGLLLFGKRAWVEARIEPRHALRVQVRPDADVVEREAAIDEAVLVEEALRVGSPLRDPVVRAHLLRAALPLARAGRSESDQVLLDRALQLGLHRADPVVRQRLAFQMEQLLLAREQVTPSAAELTAFYARERARYVRPARISFTQLFVAGRGPDAQGRAARLRERLQREAVDDAQAIALSEPTLLPHTLERVTAAALDARFGSGFAAPLFALEPGVWSAPVTSTFGLHLVRVRERLSERVPPLDEVRSELSADFREHERRKRMQRALRSLRASYDITLARSDVR